MTQAALFTGFGLLALGLMGLMLSRHLLKVVIALQVLTKGLVTLIVSAGAISGSLALAQGLALAVLLADAVVIAVSIALILQVRHQGGSLDVADLTQLKG